MQLAAAQDVRIEWERSAALIVQRQIDLAVIRVSANSSHLCTHAPGAGVKCVVIVFTGANSGS